MRKLICLLLSTIVSLDAGTLLLKDGTRAIVSVADTDGGSIIVRRKDDRVQIDKKQILFFSNDKDTGLINRQDAKSAALKSPLSVNDAIERMLSGCAVHKTALAGGRAIAFVKQPIRETPGEEKTGAEFSPKMVSFLSQYGSLHGISKEGMYFYLSGDSVIDNRYRYLASPVEITVRTSERKMSVSSFVKLDKAGNFVPTAKGETLRALERETGVRFIVVDLLNKSIVFDERVDDVDKGLKELDHKKANDTQTVHGENSILVVERKLEGLLKKQFN